MRTLLALLAALGVALGLAACGGDDDATATTAEAAAPAANVPLDQASWNTYIATRRSARTVNDTAVTTFRKCRELVGTSVSADKVQACLGTSAHDVVAEGQRVLAVLDDLAPRVSGSCADATAELRGNVKLYSSTVNAIDLTVQRSTLPTTQDIGSSLGLLTKSRAAAADFERACKPK